MPVETEVRQLYQKAYLLVIIVGWWDTSDQIVVS
jgi:hypothetical protein